ncbi:ORF 56 [Haloarcula hispanica virus SH1]|uniref:ORF 56 n=1 Tax=Haloarcula hispanica SH1 virus TaxID=326574 RepID=Q4KPD1_9VIRU|nr:ORF 56 [Haloarcula hispanica virus SH1]AAY24982.1 ORF 56 [Haloarcula hispanica virus SH1]
MVRPSDRAVRPAGGLLGVSPPRIPFSPLRQIPPSLNPPGGQTSGPTEAARRTARHRPRQPRRRRNPHLGL